MSKFSVRNLSVLAYAQGFTQWHYHTKGATLADVMQPGFWDGAGGGMFVTGDMVMVSAPDGGRILFVEYANVHGPGATLVPLS